MKNNGKAHVSHANVPIDSKTIKALVDVTLAHYASAGRHDMAWRIDTSAYSIFLSEVMLQQTQVARVTVKYAQFRERFPTFDDLARASITDVLVEWQGLGYNRRGKYLQQIAQKVVDTIASNTNTFTGTYDWNDTVENKLNAIAQKIYGADGVEYTPKAITDLKKIYKMGFDKLPICMAKTQYSLTDNPKRIGRPTGFNLTVREFEFATGAGFIIPVCGEMMRMPGLTQIPSAEAIDVDDDGKISGLF